MTPRRGEVWLWDLGMTEKVRPALVMSVSYGDLDRALITVVPHTTSLRGSEFEITVPVASLKPGAFLVQNVATYPVVRAIRRLGVLRNKAYGRCRGGGSVCGLRTKQGDGGV
jgi:mRNA interferase MazF